MPVSLERISVCSIQSIESSISNQFIDLLDVPLAALPTKAKFVAKQYQYEKRHQPNQEHLDQDDDSYDEAQYIAPKNRKNLQIGDFMTPSQNNQKNTNAQPQQPVSSLFPGAIFFFLFNSL